jgi:ribokinase
MPTIIPKVVVVGSLNVDYIASVPRLPAGGETVAATKLIRRFGGKGANQAIAAARQGARVRMIGCVGGDDEGRAYREQLMKEGIDVRGIGKRNDALTGTALIAVDQQAENTIIVTAGANGEVAGRFIRAKRKLIASANVLLLQQEIPMEAIIEAVGVARRAHVPIIFNPSPLALGFPWGDLPVETVVANAGEARSIFGLRVEEISRSLARWRRALVKNKIGRLIITRGAESTVYLNLTEYGEVSTLRVKPIDTVGAGDAFAGVLAARRAEGMEILTAIQHANCAGGLTTLLPGAQEAIPNRRQTESALRRLAGQERNGLRH